MLDTVGRLKGSPCNEDGMPESAAQQAIPASDPAENVTAIAVLFGVLLFALFQ